MSSSTTTPQKDHLLSRFWLRWTAHTALFGVVGSALASAMAVITMGIGALAAGGVVGLIVGAAQGSLLSVRAKKEGNVLPSIDPTIWAVVTFASGFLAWLAMVVIRIPLTYYGVVEPQDPIVLLLPCITGGLIFSLGQWVVLRKHSKKALWWVPLHILVFPLAALFGLWAGTLLFDIFWGSDILFTGIIFGGYELIYLFLSLSIGMIVIAILTGPVIAWLVNETANSKSEPQGPHSLITSPATPHTPAQPLSGTET